MSQLCSPAESHAVESKRRVGRSAPRSRTGCITCKRRKVRCDEGTPVCANCTRLGAECTYQTHLRHRLRQSDRNSRERPPPNAPVSSLGSAIDYLDPPLVGQDIEPPLIPGNNTLFFDLSAFSRNALDLWCSPSTALPEPPYGDIFPLEGSEELDMNVCEDVLPSALNPQNIHQATLVPQLPNPEQDSGRNGNQAEEGIGPASSKENHLLREVVPNFRRIATGMFYAPDVSNNGSDESIRRRGEALGVYFQESVFVPSVTNIDIPSWRSLCRRILLMARSSSIVSNSVVALAQLHFVKFPPSAEREKGPQVLRNGYNLAQYLYIFAKETLGNGLDLLQKEASESLRLELLVALFLLGCFELIDKEDIHRAHQLKWADNLLEGIDQSDFMVQQIIHLMLLCDARVVTLGGNGILPRRPPPLPSGPYTPVSPATNNNQAAENGHQHTNEANSQTEIRPCSPPPDRLAKRPRQLERPGQEYIPLALSTLRESILRDAVYFHHRSEQFLRRVAMLDRHRRPRGTPEDEVEVTASARNIINDLHKLWDERPAIMDSDRQELSQVLHSELARDVARLLCVFRACFWSNFCYLYRAAWWDRRTQDEEFAIEQTWKALRGSVDQGAALEKTRNLDGAGEPPLNSAAMWALWVFSTECDNLDKANWCIGKLEELGQAVDYGPGGEHATIHAAKAAHLLREVVERQRALNRRLDVRFVALELFGFMFPIL